MLSIGFLRGHGTTLVKMAHLCQSLVILYYDLQSSTWQYTNLINIIESNDPIEGGIQVIEQIHHLHWRRSGTQLCEADYVAKVNGDTFTALWLDYLACHQLLSYRPRWKAINRRLGIYIYQISREKCLDKCGWVIPLISKHVISENIFILFFIFHTS